jgi:prophage maintenance system killer protein
VTVFLNLNGWDLEAEPDELALLTRMTAQGRLPLFDIAAGLESATVRLSLEEE